MLSLLGMGTSRKRGIKIRGGLDRGENAHQDWGGGGSTIIPEDKSLLFEHSGRFIRSPLEESKLEECLRKAEDEGGGG